MTAERNIKDIIKKAEDRLFRVDKECYIIYTGNSLADIGPFVRMGNSGWLPPDLRPLVHNVIITDLLPFNLDLELSNFMGGSSKRYIGEEESLERVIGLLESSGVEADSIKQIAVGKSGNGSGKDSSRKEKIGAGNGQDRSYALFYSDSNIVVTYGDQRIFELLKEVRSDRGRFSEDEVNRRVRKDRRRLEELLRLFQEKQEGAAEGSPAKAAYPQRPSAVERQSAAKSLASSDSPRRSQAASHRPKVSSLEAQARQDAAGGVGLGVPDGSQALKGIRSGKGSARLSISPKKGSTIGAAPAVYIPRSLWIATGTVAVAIGLILGIVLGIPSVRVGLDSVASRGDVTSRANEPRIGAEERGGRMARPDGGATSQPSLGSDESEVALSQTSDLPRTDSDRPVSGDDGATSVAVARLPSAPLDGKGGLAVSENVRRPEGSPASQASLVKPSELAGPVALKPTSDEQDQQGRLPENVMVVKGKEGDAFTRRITTYEVFEYVNKIALLNGYYRIGDKGANLKNPDLIYPDNELIMPSGDRRVVVKRGDTIWKIAAEDLQRVF
jgi:hypothetical protein